MSRGARAGNRARIIPRAQPGRRALVEASQGRASKGTRERTAPSTALATPSALCASSAGASVGSPGYRNLQAYSLKGAASRNRGSRLASSSQQAWPSSTRLWVLRNGTPCNARKPFNAFSTACCAWKVMSFVNGGVAVNSNSAMATSSLARVSYALTSASNSGSCGMKEFPLAQDRGWQ